VTVYLSLPQVLTLLEDLVGAFGGLSGIRDRGLLESALARPAMTFGGEDLYPDLAVKAAALMHSLVLNHPFVDGNKRIAVAAAELFLSIHGQMVMASDKELELITLSGAEGKVEVEAFGIWFRQRLRPVDER
jgi:death-on-curing protein